MAAVTSADADHLDIYGTEEEYLKGFEDFVSLVRPGGVLVMKYGLPIKAKVSENVTVYSYSRDCGDFHAENVFDMIEIAVCYNEKFALSFAFINEKIVHKKTSFTS